MRLDERRETNSREKEKDKQYEGEKMPKKLLIK